MRIAEYLRFKRDVNYSLLVYPNGGVVPENMTPSEGKTYCKWFISSIPERMEYFRNRCANDSGISVDDLDYSAESLILVWRWFLKTARMERTPKAMLAGMKQRAGALGDFAAPKKILTVATHFIMYDIAMYVGQCFVLNHPNLKWCYWPQPQDSVTVNQPAIARFHVVVESSFGTMESESNFYPVHMVGIQAAKLYRKAQTENDLYDVFVQWSAWIPK